jgi:hypothetical protein
MFDGGNCLRDRGLRNGKIGGRFSHAARLRHGKQNVQVAQLQSSSDAICPLHAMPMPEWV